VTIAFDSALFAKPIAVVPGMMGIACAFRLPPSAFALRASADKSLCELRRTRSLHPSYALGAGQAKIRKTRRFEITCSALAKLGRIIRPV
jgi:hypothetical protein